MDQYSILTKNSMEIENGTDRMITIEYDKWPTYQGTSMTPSNKQKIQIERSKIKNVNTINLCHLIEVSDDNKTTVFYHTHYLTDKETGKLFVVEDHYKKIVHMNHCIYYDDIKNCFYLIHNSHLESDMFNVNIKKFTIHNNNNIEIEDMIYIHTKYTYPMFFFVKCKNGNITSLCPKLHTNECHFELDICNLIERTTFRFEEGKCVIVTKNGSACIYVRPDKVGQKKLKYVPASINGGHTN